MQVYFLSRVETKLDLSRALYPAYTLGSHSPFSQPSMESLFVSDLCLTETALILGQYWGYPVYTQIGQETEGASPWSSSRISSRRDQWKAEDLPSSTGLALVAGAARKGRQWILVQQRRTKRHRRRGHGNSMMVFPGNNDPCDCVPARIPFPPPDLGGHHCLYVPLWMHSLQCRTQGRLASWTTEGQRQNQMTGHKQNPTCNKLKMLKKMETDLILFSTKPWPERRERVREQAIASCWNVSTFPMCGRYKQHRSCPEYLVHCLYIYISDYQKRIFKPVNQICASQL